MIVAGIASQGHTHPCCFVKTYQIKHAGTDLTFQLYPSNAAPKVGWNIFVVRGLLLGVYFSNLTMPCESTLFDVRLKH